MKIDTGEAAVIAAVVLVVVALAAAVTHEAASEKLSLVKSDWACDRTQERRYSYPQMVGKVTIMQTGVRKECVLWRRLN